MRRFLLLYVVPVLGLVLLTLVPQIRGTETLYFRDVLQAHYGVKTAQAEAWRAGYVPELDVYRAGGQPLAGNPNSVPFYPDNLLYLVAPVLWALNAHFWIHLLLAPLAAYWLGRAWGLRREAAWAVGVCYGFSGYFLSHLSFYNLVAGAALAPALAAACLRVQTVWQEVWGDVGSDRREGTRHEGRWHPRRLLAATAGLWALLVLSGDPFMALLAFLLAATAVWARAGTLHPRTLFRRVPVPALAGAFSVGTLLAAPQWVEFLRVLPLSFRGHFGYGGEAGVLESLDPHQLLEWWIPLAFGRPDRLELASFWGWDYYQDFPPYYFSLFPGLVAVALLVASGRPRGGRAWWAWGGIAGGVFLALGAYNPAAAWIFEGGLLRFPIKCWLLAAVGASLLCGIGFERVFTSGSGSDPEAGSGSHRRRFWLPLGVLGTLYALTGGGLVLARGPATALVRSWIPERYSDAFVGNELLRWAGLALFCCLLALAVALVFRGLRRRPVLAGALVLLLHAGSQLFFLAPLRDTDAVLPYVTPPPTLAHVPEDARVVDGGYLLLFGEDSAEIVPLPGPGSHWLSRRQFYELAPASGPQWRRRYQLNVSPEGLDGFVTEIARSATVYRTRTDLEKIRLLRAWGVDTLLLGRRLDPPALQWVADVHEVPGYGTSTWIYRLADPAPEVLFTDRVVSVPDITETVEVLKGPDFDPLREVTLPGERGTVEPGAAEPGPPESGPSKEPNDGASPGTARFVTRGPESFEIAVDAATAGVLSVQRSHLDLWRAAVTGETARGERLEAREVSIQPTNLQRMGVELEPGRYRVRFWVDRRPLALAGGLALLGFLGFVALLVPRLRLGVRSPPS